MITVPLITVFMFLGAERRPAKPLQLVAARRQQISQKISHLNHFNLEHIYINIHTHMSH